MKPKSFAKLLEEARKRNAYWTADAIYTFTEEIHRLAEHSKVSRAELARRLGVTPAYITKIFRGDVNFTIESMVRLARAVGGRLHLHVAADDEPVLWFSIPSRSKSKTWKTFQADEYEGKLSWGG